MAYIPRRPASLRPTLNPTAGAGRGDRFNRILKPGLDRVELWKMIYPRSDRDPVLETVFRIFPAPTDKIVPAGDAGDEPMPPFAPYRWFAEGEELGPFGSWLANYWVVSGFGVSGKTFVCGNPNDESVDIWRDRPAPLLYSRIKKAVKDEVRAPGGDNWARLLFEDENTRKQLVSPDIVYLVQGAIYLGGSGPYDSEAEKPLTVPIDADLPRGLAADDPTVVISLSSGAGRSLLGACDARTDEGNGDPNDWALFTHGDPVDIDVGRFVHVYRKGLDPRQVQVAPAASSRPSYGRSRAASTRKGDVGYGLFMSETIPFSGVEISPALSEVTELVRERWRPWDKLVWTPTAEEEAHFIAKECGLPLSALEYAWQDHPSWLNDEAVKALRNPVSTSAPARRTGVMPARLAAPTPAEPAADAGEDMTLEEALQRQEEKAKERVGVNPGNGNGGVVNPLQVQVQSRQSSASLALAQARARVAASQAPAESITVPTSAPVTS